MEEEGERREKPPQHPSKLKRHHYQLWVWVVAAGEVEARKRQIPQQHQLEETCHQHLQRQVFLRGIEEVQKKSQLERERKVKLHQCL